MCWRVDIDILLYIRRSVPDTTKRGLPGGWCGVTFLPVGMYDIWICCIMVGHVWIVWIVYRVLTCWLGVAAEIFWYLSTYCCTYVNITQPGTLLYIYILQREYDMLTDACMDYYCYHRWFKSCSCCYARCYSK